MLALMLRSRIRRFARDRRRADALRADSEFGESPSERPPRYVSNREFFAPKLTPTLANPNALCLKRIQVM
jgi:hypothetical protein